MINKKTKKKEQEDNESNNSDGGKGLYKNLISPETLTEMFREAIKKDIKNGIFTEKQGEIMLKELAKAKEASRNKENKKTI